MYAPRRVTLPPREPQTMRIAARAPKDLPDGEYRVHLLFRAVPPPTPVEAPKDVKGVSFKLTTIYGVTIPVIARFGNLEATAAIANVKRTTADGKPAISLQLTRKGDRSTFGEVRVMKAGIKDPIAVQRGIAIYTEIGQRTRHHSRRREISVGRATVGSPSRMSSPAITVLTIAESDAVLN